MFGLSGTSQILLIIFILFCVQALGGYYQIKDYQKAVRRVHKLGNVGIGQKKGRFLSGHIVMIACNADGIITGGEVMEGLSFFTKFKPITSFLGRDIKGQSIYNYLDELRSLDKKLQKKHKGYLRALESLEMRLKDEITL